jgi:hypothetical protein
VDHIQPKSKGGADAWLNLLTACHECNIGKFDSLLSPEVVEGIIASLPLEPEKVVRQVQRAVRKVVNRILETFDSEAVEAKPRVRFYCKCPCECRERLDDAQEPLCGSCYEEHCRECGQERLIPVSDDAYDVYRDTDPTLCMECFEDEHGLLEPEPV